jgi:DNA-binding response OmpR family regulator
VQKILIVDDDESMRGLLRMRLSDAYEVIDTGDPAQALGLVLESKPNAIFLDLMMPGFSGFELCQSLQSLSYTARIPIFVITGESGAKYKDHCKQLGATAFFEKPVDFKALKETLANELQAARPERRVHLRVRMRLALKLRGTDAAGRSFEELTSTENVSAGGFLSVCLASLSKDALVDVFLAGEPPRYVGRARAVHRDVGGPWPRYGFQFTEKNSEWVLQGK